MRPVSNAFAAVREGLLVVASELLGARSGHRGRGDHSEGFLERPPRKDLGDYSTNAALLLAPLVGRAPRDLAQDLGNGLVVMLGADLERFEVAGSGFLNLYLSDRWHRRALAEILDEQERFGGSGASGPERILLEFVSANPTGPMHVGHARNAAYGDSLARLLAFHGHEVEREFYVNDAGSQIRKLGESIAALARGEAVPEDGYHGDYVVPLVAEVRSSEAGPQLLERMDPSELGEVAVAIMVARTAKSLESFRVSFDCWQYESALHSGDASPVEHVLALLDEQERTYRSEDALWLRTTDHGDDKNRVLVRSSGSTPTSPRTSLTTSPSASVDLTA